MTAVWVVRDEDGIIENVVMKEPKASDLRDLRQLGNTVTRETILTPTHARVIEAAVAMADFLGVTANVTSGSLYLTAKRGLLTAVATLRELEGEV